ncbi:hypothetical protein IV203_005014 [Nitzschia inconspicua]|uniref:Uncharacterized protein n=1 Tax=Nitzschia inconspicua TaxID=303405 RepID=A0A9K3KLJ0_9STRA|nr:hypothetical protein IV203_005014 [Nitzschia inconspicua]
MWTSDNKLATKPMELDSILLRPGSDATGFEVGKRKSASVVFMNGGAKNGGMIGDDADRWSKSKQKFSKGQKLTHSRGQCGVFSLHRRCRNVTLEFGRPNDRTVGDTAGETGSQFHTGGIRLIFMGPETSKISVDSKLGLCRSDGNVNEGRKP